jgi:hypothetical protein
MGFGGEGVTMLRDWQQYRGNSLKNTALSLAIPYTVGLGRVVQKITGSNPSDGNELTFRSDLLLAPKDGST